MPVPRYLQGLGDEEVYFMPKPGTWKPKQLPERRPVQWSYWHSASNLAKWYNKIQTQPPDQELPPWLDREGVTAAYQYQQYMNRGRPWWAWGAIHPDDPYNDFLVEIPNPPLEELSPVWRERKQAEYEELTSPYETPYTGAIPAEEYETVPWDQSTYDKVVQELAGGVPDEIWQQLPYYQKALMTLLGSGSRAGAAIGGTAGLFGGLGGALAGGGIGTLLGGGIGGGLLGSVLGKAMEKYPSVGKFMEYLDYPALWLEQAIGTFGILAGSPFELAFGEIDKQKFNDLWNNIDAVWQASALMEEAMALGFVGGKTFDLGVPGVRIVEDDPSKLLYEVFDRIVSGEPLEDIYTYYIGRPHPILSEGAVGTGELGMTGMLGDLIGHIALDPLNYAGAFMKLPVKVAAVLSGNDVLQAAAHLGKGPIETLNYYRRRLQLLPEEKVAQLSPAARYFAGISPDGTLKWMQQTKPATRAQKAAGAALALPVGAIGYGIGGVPGAILLGGSFGIYGYKQGLPYLFTLTPEARAAEFANIAHTAIKYTLDATEDGPAGKNKYLHMIANTPRELSHELSMEIWRSPEASIVPAAVAGYLEKADALLDQWNKSEWMRLMATNIAATTGKSIDDVVRELADMTDARTLLDQYVSLARNVDSDEARAIVQAYDLGKAEPNAAGALKAENLQDMAKAWIEDKVPYTEDLYSAALFGGLTEHLGEYGGKWFGVKPDPALIRIARALKSAQSAVLLGLNPTYYINNAINNPVTMAASSVLGIMTPAQARNVWRRMGWSLEGADIPMRLTAGLGPHATASEAVQLQSLRKMTRAGDWIQNVEDLFGKASNRLPFTMLSSMAESSASLNATTSGLLQAWGKLWKRGVGYDRMPGNLERMLDAFQPGLKELIYDGIDASMNKQEIIDNLYSGVARRSVRSMLDDVATKQGLDPGEVREAWTQLGLFDDIERAIREAESDQDIRDAFRNITEKIEDELDLLTEQRVRSDVEEAANIAAAEGLRGVFKAYDDGFVDDLEFQFRHWLRMDDLSQRAEIARQTTGSGGFIWEEGLRIEDKRYRRHNKRMAARLKGFIDGLGDTATDSKAGRSIVDEMGAIFDEWGEFYRTRRQMYDDLRTGKLDDYEGLQAKLLDIYRATVESTEKRYAAMDAGFVKMFGDDVASLVEAWRSGVAEIRQNNYAVMDQMRASGDTDWRAFLHDKGYLERLRQLVEVNRDGLEDIERALTGLDPLHREQVPEPPERPPDVDWQMGGADISEGRRAQAEREAAEAAEDVPENLAEFERLKAQMEVQQEAARRQFEEKNAEVMGKIEQEQEWQRVAAEKQKKAADALEIAREYDLQTPGAGEGSEGHAIHILNAIKRYAPQELQDQVQGWNSLADVEPDLMRKALEERARVKQKAVEIAEADRVYAENLRYIQERPFKELDPVIRDAMEGAFNNMLEEALEPQLSVLRFIREEGGINIKYMPDIALEGKYQAKDWGPGLFTRKGMPLDHFIVRMTEEGYIPTDIEGGIDYGLEARVIEMIQDELAKRQKYYPMEGKGPEQVPDWYKNVHTGSRKKRPAIQQAIQQIIKGEESLVYGGEPTGLENALKEEAFMRLEDIAEYDEQVARKTGFEYRGGEDYVPVPEGMDRGLGDRLASLRHELYTSEDQATVDAVIDDLNNIYIEFGDDEQLLKAFNKEIDDLYDAAKIERNKYTAELEDVPTPQEAAQEAAEISQAQLDAAMNNLIEEIRQKERINRRYQVWADEVNRPMDALPAPDVREMMRSGLRDYFNLSEEQIGAQMELWEARARSWASYTNKSPDDWWRSRFRGIVRGIGDEKPLYQGSATGYGGPIQWEQRALKMFGETWDRREAGYILEDGTMLDFSGKSEGGTPGVRAYDHRDIGRAVSPDVEYRIEEEAGEYVVYRDMEGERWEEQLDIFESMEEARSYVDTLEQDLRDTDMWRETGGGSEGMLRFMADTGAMRVHVGDDWAMIDISSAPTRSQMRFIRDLLENDFELAVDINHPKTGLTVFSHSEINFHNFDEVIQQIDDTFGRWVSLYQGERGAIEFRDNMALLMALENPDLTTTVHETGHLFRRDLYRTYLETKDQGLYRDIETLERWVIEEVWRVYGKDKQALGDNRQWSVEAEETFARALERFMYDGIPPTEGLRGLFDQFKSWLINIYTTITGSAIDINISPELRGVINRMLTERTQQGVGQMDMFGPEGGMPLFTGTPMRGREGAFRPREVDTTRIMPGFEEAYKPQMEGARPGGEAETIKGAGVEMEPQNPAAAEYINSLRSKAKKDYAIAVDEALRKGLGTDAAPRPDNLSPMAAQAVEMQMRPMYVVGIEELYDLASTLATRYESLDAFRASDDFDLLMEGVRRSRGDVTEDDMITALERYYFEDAAYREAEAPKPSALVMGSQTGVPTALMLARRDYRKIKPNVWRTLEKSFDYPKRGVMQRSEFIEAIFNDPDTILERDIGTGSYPHAWTDSVSGETYGATKSEVEYYDWLKENIGSYEQRSSELAAQAPGIPPATDADYWGSYIARIVKDPRNITKEEWTALQPIYDHLLDAAESADDYWVAARQVAETIAENEGRYAGYGGIIEGGTEDVTGLRPTEEVRGPRPRGIEEPTARPAEGLGAVGETGRVAGMEGPGAARRAATPERDVTPWLRDIERPPLTRRLTTSAIDVLDEDIGQVTDTRRILSAFDRGERAYVLANGTGTGKTFVALGVIAEQQPRKALIVVPNRNIATQWSDIASQYFGLNIDAGKDIPTEGTWITTYTSMRQKGKQLVNQNFDLIIFDESHKLKTYYKDSGSAQAKVAMDIINTSPEGKVIFASATPFQSIAEMKYLESMGLWDAADRYAFDEFLVNHNYNYITTKYGGYWRFDGTVDDILDMYRELNERGVMSQRELQMDANLRNRFVRQPLNSDIRFIYNRVNSRFDEAAGVVGSYHRGMINAQRTIANRRIMEVAKADTAIDLARRLEAEGRQVAIFVGFRGEAKPPEFKSRKLLHINRILEDIYTDLDAMETQTVDKIVNALGGPKEVAQVHGGVAARVRDVDINLYNKGRKKYLVATAAAGGTGLSLHDTVGNAPRAQINIYLPWSGQDFQQVAGRSYRYGSASDVDQYWIFADTPKEASIASTVGGRLEEMGALVGGIDVNTDARRIAAFDLGMIDELEEMGGADTLYQSDWFNTDTGAKRIIDGSDDTNILYQGGDGNVNTSKLDGEDPQATGLPVGSIEAMDGEVPLHKVSEEGYDRFILPLMDGLEQSYLNGEANVPASVRDTALPEDVSNLLKMYLQKVYGQMNDTKIASQRWAEMRRDAALLNYSRRYGIDNVATALIPYQFWYTRSALQWALRAIDRPSWFANYGRINRMQEQVTAQPGFPTRLLGKMRMKVHLPWLPESYNEIYFDPWHQLFPFSQLTYGAWEQPAQIATQQGRRAVYIIQQWVADEKITQDQAIEALKIGGTTWEKAFAQAAAEMDNEISTPADYIAGITGYSLPLEWWRQYNKGTPENINQLPATRLIQSATSFLTPGGINIEGWVRNKLGLPERGKWWDYYIDRELANMAAEGLITADEAMQTMVERQGRAYDMAMDRVGKYQATRQIGGALWLDFFPEGEAEQRALGVEFGKIIDTGDSEMLSEWFENHPEYKARLLMGDWDSPEGRLRNFTIGRIWERYREGKDLEKTQWREAFGQVYEDAFLNKETRSYDSIDTQTLLQWAQVMGVEEPETTPGYEMPPIEEIDYEFAPPEVQDAVQEYHDERKRLFPEYSYDKQEIFFMLPDELQDQYLEENPWLEEYWQWANKYKADHPEIIQYSIGEDSVIKDAPPELQQLYYEYKSSIPSIFGGDIYDVQNSYYDLPAGARRREFLKEHPELLGMWQYRYTMLQNYPELIPYIYPPEGRIDEIATKQKYTESDFALDLSQFTPALNAAMNAYYNQGAKLGSGAKSELSRIWKNSGRPGGDLNTWIESLFWLYRE